MTFAPPSTALQRAELNSPFLRGLMERQPDLHAVIARGDFDAALANALARTSDDIGTTLRYQRQGVALVTAIADLSGAWDLTRVTRTLSDFADQCLQTAIATAIEERTPGAPNQGFAVIALGKHGGQELNYSSDIDPIFLFDPATLPHRDRDDVADAAVRIGRRVIEMLSARDQHGYVFRVDMRLRPSPEVSPIALPVNAAIGYYESSALAWEQAAFIRARFAAGDAALGNHFLKSIQPFIWRRSLDFGQLRNIKAMSAQIRDHYSAGQTLGLGYDLKRGRGGIRECEFFAQAHQLIHGGRNPALRMADTRQALAALAAADAIDGDEAAALSDAYVMLRTTEHRLQMIDDRQTHNIPDTIADCDRVARLHGLADGQALLDMLSPKVAGVSAVYDGLVGADSDAATRLASDGLPLDDQLQQIGFTDTDDIKQRLVRWRSGKLRAIRSAPAKEAFEAVLPDILTALAKAPDPDRALARFDNMIEALPSAINIFLLFEARPALLQLVADILSYAPVLAEALGRRAELLDGLIDASALELPGDVVEQTAALRAKTDSEEYQDILDRVRSFVGEQRFALGVQLIEGRQDPTEIAHAYAHLAEAALDVLTAATVQEFERRHGQVPGSELMILALGRLGGEALTHASDLDLVLLFTGDHAAESDGDRPLGATQYFNRLAQRVIAALTVATASGALYEIDTRLRPSGAKGLLCGTVNSFEHYQRGGAWVWEHMALTRARPVFGSTAARKNMQSLITDILQTSRNPVALLNDIAQMRRDMAVHKPAKGPLDVKLLPGGLVDMEFIIHALQLRGGVALVPQLDRAAAALVSAGQLDSKALDAMTLLSRLLVLVRLVAPDCVVPPEPAQRLIAHNLGFGDWNVLITEIDAARAVVMHEWQLVFGNSDSHMNASNLTQEI